MSLYFEPTYPCQGNDAFCSETPIFRLVGGLRRFRNRTLRYEMYGDDIAVMMGLTYDTQLTRDA
jgi:hypothetical protein